MSDINSINAKFKLAVEQHGLGRFPQALALYDDIIRMNPAIAEVHLNRAVALAALNNISEALQSFDQAIRLNPNIAQAHLHKAAGLLQLGHNEEAIVCLDRALKLKPDYAEALVGKSDALIKLLRPYEALECLDRAIKINPAFALAYLNRSTLFRDLKQPENALRDISQAITLQPANAAAHSDKATILQNMGRLEEALASCEAALKINPAFAPAYFNKGVCLQALNKIEDALQNYDRATTLFPDFVDAQWNKGLCVLLAGRMEEGWPLYEWRKQRYPASFPVYPKPQWRGGEDIKGKTVFVHVEQGLGDTIQFARYAALLSARGAHVILSVQESLMRLFGTLGPDIELLAWPMVPEAFDYYVPLHSLAMAFEGEIPASVPYISAEPELVEKWKARIGTKGFKVGICWQGNRQSQIDAGRSLPLRMFEGLAKLPNVRLISLQKGDGTEQLRDLPVVETLGDDFDAGSDAFVDTAAVMANLDLIITSDMAVAHVAGALGRPTWVALRQVPDWRWQMGRADSPWYPSLKLFRQKTRDDWSGLFAELQTSLREISVL